MEEYFNTLNDEIKHYLKILSPEFPEWLFEYINTSEMSRLNGIAMSCGVLYSKVYDDKYFYSVLTHSIAVALIIWNFTHDKKQTLAGLFHDIATPAFKHCIDFMNGDSEYQESTEERTIQIIKESKEIIRLLNRDNIQLEEVVDYHIYPIADNELPKLSSDRLEYTLSGGLYQLRVFELEDIEKYYKNLLILENEDGYSELGFKDLKVCEDFMKCLAKLWPRWIEDEDRLCMQFIADIIKCKKRYINPLVNCKDKVFRAKDISPIANKCINDFLNIKLHKYIGFDFYFKPYGI